MENNYFKNEFYHQISALEDVSSDLKTLIEKNESGFYEVCKKYAEIVLNSGKIKDEKSKSVQGKFWEADIDSAKGTTKEFVEKFDIRNVEELMEVIHIMYQNVINNENKGQMAVLWQQEVAIFGRCGMLLDLTKLPEDIWQEIKKDTLEYCGVSKKS